MLYDLICKWKAINVCPQFQLAKWILLKIKYQRAKFISLSSMNVPLWGLFQEIWNKIIWFENHLNPSVFFYYYVPNIGLRLSDSLKTHSTLNYLQWLSNIWKLYLYRLELFIYSYETHLTHLPLIYSVQLKVVFFNKWRNIDTTTFFLLKNMFIFEYLHCAFSDCFNNTQITNKTSLQREDT